MKARLIVAFLSVVCCNACHSTKQPVPGKVAPHAGQTDLTHKVKIPGETLGYISQWYTGTWDNWPKLAENNPKIKVNKIKLGQSVVIPSNLLATKQPLTKENLRKLQKEHTQSRASLKRTSTKLAKPVDDAVADLANKPKTTAALGRLAEPAPKQVRASSSKPATAPVVTASAEPVEMAAVRREEPAPAELAPEKLADAPAVSVEAALKMADRSPQPEVAAVPEPVSEPAPEAVSKTAAIAVPKTFTESITEDELPPDEAPAAVQPAAVQPRTPTANEVALDREIEEIAKELKQKDAAVQENPINVIVSRPAKDGSPAGSSSVDGGKPELGNKSPEHVGGSLFTCRSDNCSLTIVD